MKFDIGTTAYRNNAKQRNLKNGFLYLAFLSLAIVSSYGAFLSVDVPFPAILIFLFFMFCYCMCSRDKLIKFTYIPVLLLIRLFIFCVNALILDISKATLFGEITITACSILLFLCGYNFLSEKKKEIKNVLTLFSLITSIQIIICVITKSMGNKAEIVAGIGASNYAAGFILLCVSYLIFIRPGRLEKLVVVLDIIAILATQSFGAYSALTIVLLLFLMKRVNWCSKKVRQKALLLIGLIVVVIIVFFNTSLGKGAWKKIIDKLFFLLRGDWSNFGSSRLELFGFSWNNIKRHLLFGTIDNYDISILEGSPRWRFQYARTHNVILESLLQYGLIGSFINIAILCNIGKLGRKGRNKKRNIHKLAFISCFTAIIIHSMLEPTIFTLHFEVFMWFLIGAYLSCNRQTKSDFIDGGIR